MNTKFLILGIVALAIVGGALFLLTPSAAADYADPVDVQTRSQNANLAAALFSGGIEDPFVDVDEERVYVAYDLPEGFDVEQTQRFVIGAAADAAPESLKIVALQYVNDEPSVMWSVSMEDYKAFMRGEITEETLEGKTTKQTF